MANKKEEKSTKVTNIKDAKSKKVDFEGTIKTIIVPKKEGFPKIVYKRENEKGTHDITFKGKEQPTDDFICAMRKLVYLFLDACELEDKEGLTTVTHANLTDKGIIISAQIELENGIKQPLCINSTTIPFEPPTDGYAMSKEHKALIDELKRQAIMYMRGVSTQQKLFKEG